MKFEYSAAPQRSPEWFALRLGKVTASRLVDWMAVSKAEKTKGAPLKARLDYEKELMFERMFNRSFDRFVTPAMQDGVDFEGFARRQYEKINGVLVNDVGCWHNELFVASPDGAVYSNPDEVDGIVEIKVLKDNSFTEVLTEGVPDKHWKQIQGQLWASGAKWCDYIAINLSTRKIKVIRVLPDAEFHEWLELIVPEKLVTAEFDASNLYDFVDPLPAGAVEAFSANNSNNSDGDWSK